jgi:hypothetical protein
MQIGRRYLVAGCDSEGRVRLWLSDKNGDNLVALSHETWATVTESFGYTVGELVNVSIETNRAESSTLHNNG